MRKISKDLTSRIIDQNLGATGELFWDDGESIIPNDDLSQHNYHHFVYNFTLTNSLAVLNITQTRAAVSFLNEKRNFLDEHNTKHGG